MKIDNQQAIGIFDSGVGGLSIVKAIHQLLPNEKLIYVADNLHAPYGEKSDSYIESRVLSIADFLAQKNVKAMVVACNTATAAAVQSLRNTYPIPIIGLEPALKPAAEYSKNKKVGVIATKYTLTSQKYKTLRARFADQIEIIEKASPIFVELVETTEFFGEAEIEVIKHELQPFIDAQVDSLVLGCTHYPFLQNNIKQILGEQVKLFESGFPVASELKRRLADQLSCKQSINPIDYYSSNPKKTQAIFELIIGSPVLINQLPN